MKHVDLSPWARGTLTADQRERLRMHLAPGCSLEVIGATPARFTVRASTGASYVERFDIPRAVLWDTIVAELDAIGHPLLSDEDWAVASA